MHQAGRSEQLPKPLVRHRFAGMKDEDIYKIRAERIEGRVILLNLRERRVL